MYLDLVKLGTANLMCRYSQQSAMHDGVHPKGVSSGHFLPFS